MHSTQHINFLQERIAEIGSAIFYNLSDAVLKLPTSIITSVKADDYGFIWFMVEKSTRHVKEFEHEFPVKMDFYKKGAACFLQVTGQGFLVSDPEEINNTTHLPEEMKDLTNEKYALVKVRIQKADYYENRSVGKIAWWQQAWQMVASWLGNNSYRPGTIYLPAS